MCMKMEKEIFIQYLLRGKSSISTYRERRHKKNKQIYTLGYNDKKRARLKTLPSPLISSAGPKRACKQRRHRGREKKR